MSFVLCNFVALGKSLPLFVPYCPHLEKKSVDPKSFQVPSSLMFSAQMHSAHHKA